MRILGGKDYYDGARAFGEDRDVVFARQNHVKAPWSELFWYPTRLDVRGHVDYTGRRHGFQTRVPRTGSMEHHLYSMYVWVAGTRYFGVKVVRRSLDYLRAVYENQYFWHREALDQYLEKYQIEFHERSKYAHHRDNDINNPEELFGPKEATREEQDFMIDNRVVVAIYDQEEELGSPADDIPYKQRGELQWKINTDGLKGISFGKCVDPYQAYQELSMYVGGVLPRQMNPIVELQGESIMVAKHGFDEWSFRKQSEKSK